MSADATHYEFSIRSFLHYAPTGIWIEFGHGRGGLCGGLTQVFLEQHAILVHDEGHHSRIAVFCRIGDDGKSTYHLPIDHIILGTTWRLTALPGQHTEV